MSVKILGVDRNADHNTIRQKFYAKVKAILTYVNVYCIMYILLIFNSRKVKLNIGPLRAYSTEREKLIEVRFN